MSKTSRHPHSVSRAVSETTTGKVSMHLLAFWWSCMMKSNDILSKSSYHNEPKFLMNSKPWFCNMQHFFLLLIPSQCFCYRTDFSILHHHSQACSGAGWNSKMVLASLHNSLTEEWSIALPSPFQKYGFFADPFNWGSHFTLQLVM